MPSHTTSRANYHTLVNSPLPCSSLTPRPLDLPTSLLLRSPLAILLPPPLPVRHNGRLEIQRTRQHITVPRPAAETPLRVESGGAGEKLVAHEAGWEGGHGRFDVIVIAIAAAAVRVAVGGVRVCAHGWCGAGEGVGWSLRAGAEEGVC